MSNVALVNPQLAAQCGVVKVLLRILLTCQVLYMMHTTLVTAVNC